MESITMTAEELENVRRELHELESSGRSAIAARIKTAREWGDLKENGEYHAAKEDQAHLETRISRLRAQVRNADIVEAGGGGGAVAHGATVTWKDRTSDREQTLRIVSPNEARPAEGTLSVQSPIARALLGHKVGDVVEVETPAGGRQLEIITIA